MGRTITEKILQRHLLEGELIQGSQIAVRIDQTLTQDATGTMAYLAFESMGLPRVKTELSVAYVDHNTLQCGYENADDHRYLQTVAAKYGVLFSRPGNGICHQVHLERLGKPGKTLLGSDSHTPTAGGLGMLAFGAGGMDVAVAMAGGGYYLKMPKQYKIRLTGVLRPNVTAKDVSLELLKRLTVKGGVGAVIEWGGPGVKTLSVPQRATIANMGAEMGATSSIFPSDEKTREFLAAQGRQADYVPLSSDEDAVYDRTISIDLSLVEPMIACPHSPDNVVSVRSLPLTPVDQVCIGSCTNSSLRDLLNVASILKGRTIAPGVSLSVSPGSRQVLRILADCGALTDILASGARILECACGPCIGMGFSPGTGGVSLRTFNRNFHGRSGTKEAGVYLVSPETAAVSALTGYITDPTSVAVRTPYQVPDRFTVDDSGFLPPLALEEAACAAVVRGPNIKPFPKAQRMQKSFSVRAVLKVEDDITTDHIMPAGAKVLPYRSNIPMLSQFCFGGVDPAFSRRAEEAGTGIILAGKNYGQGSSREHAALVPMYLGIRCVLAKSFARIHEANLINAGILPLTFADPDDYQRIEMDHVLRLEDIPEGLDRGTITLYDETSSRWIQARCQMTQRQKQILLAGGLLAYIKEGGK